jgi:hypothetical protein
LFVEINHGEIVHLFGFHYKEYQDVRSGKYKISSILYTDINLFNFL